VVRKLRVVTYAIDITNKKIRVLKSINSPVIATILVYFFIFISNILIYHILSYYYIIYLKKKKKKIEGQADVPGNSKCFTI
jgi:hypothetical protein